MDVAAQQIQREVQGVSRHGDDEEHHHVAGDGAQGVEHLSDDAAGQHQGHQPGVGQDVPEIAGHVVVQGAEDPGDLPESLSVDDRPGHYQHNARIQHQVRHPQHCQRDSGEDHPPGDLLPERVQELSALQLPYHADHHAGEDLDKAQAHGAHQNHQRVVQRREQGWQGERALRVDQLGQLGEEIAEETACQGAHHKGADAAQAQQAEEVLHRSLRAVCPQDKDGGQHHQQSVSHIRHHHAIEEDEKRRHEGVGVHIVIGRQGVHLRHHVQRPGQTVVLQLHRHLRILLRRGIRRLPGTAQALQQGAHVRHALRRGPSLEEDNGPVGKQPLRRALPSGLRCQPVRVGPQGVPLPGALRNGRLGLLPPALELLQLPVGLLQIRCRRAGDPRKSSRAEAVGPQDLHYRLLRRPVAEEQQVSLLLVGADLQQLRRQRLQL